MLTTTSLTLLEGIRDKQDAEAWREFFRRYAPMLLSFAARLGLSDADANEAMQETMIAVHRTFQESSEPFDRSKGRFKSWLRGVAKHKVRDVQRRTGQRDALTERLVRAADEPVDPDAMDEEFERQWQRSTLAWALDRMATEVDPAVYQAFVLYAVQGSPANEVASLLGVSRNAVFLSKHRLIRRIRELVGEIRESEG